MIVLHYRFFKGIDVMKKLISVLLALILTLSCTVTAFAGIDYNSTRSQIPVIRISGDGDPLYNSEGEKIIL